MEKGSVNHRRDHGRDIDCPLPPADTGRGRQPRAESQSPRAAKSWPGVATASRAGAGARRSPLELGGYRVLVSCHDEPARVGPATQWYPPGPQTRSALGRALLPFRRRPTRAWRDRLLPGCRSVPSLNPSYQALSGATFFPPTSTPLFEPTKDGTEPRYIIRGLLFPLRPLRRQPKYGLARPRIDPPSQVSMTSRGET
jgi:hypothetical protein